MPERPETVHWTSELQVKGYGFISCEAFPDQDVFVLKSELPQGGLKGGVCG